MAAYVIYQCEVLDPDAYETYKARASESIRRAGGRYLVRGGALQVLEGDPDTGRTVILEFPSREAVLDWYQSDEYVEVRALRASAATASLVVVDGL